MTRFKLFCSAAILSALSATPAMAQRMIDEPGMYAFYHPNGDLGIASTRSPANAMASLRDSNTMQLRMAVKPRAVHGKRAAQSH